MKQIRIIDFVIGLLFALPFGGLAWLGFRGVLTPLMGSDAAGFAEFLGIILVSGSVGLMTGTRGGARFFPWICAGVALVFSASYVLSETNVSTTGKTSANTMIGLVLFLIAGIIYAWERIAFANRGSVEFMLIEENRIRMEAEKSPVMQKALEYIEGIDPKISFAPRPRFSKLVGGVVAALLATGIFLFWVDVLRAAMALHPATNS